MSLIMISSMKLSLKSVERERKSGRITALVHTLLVGGEHPRQPLGLCIRIQLVVQIGTVIPAA